MNKYFDIDGTEELLKIFGEWPSFHDSEVLSVMFDRNAIKGRYGPTLIVKIHCFQITNEVINGCYKTINHHIIEFAFYDAVEVSLGYGFGQQNSLSGFFISDIREYQLDNVNYEVHFDGHTKCDLRFKCSKIEVQSIEPGIPEGSVYLRN